MSKKRDKHNECHSCKHRRSIPGNCHIQCAQPDPDMSGHTHGIRSGWFCYPRNFDPVWKTKDCANFEERA